jgi:hypothetical protein
MSTTRRQVVGLTVGAAAGLTLGASAAATAAQMSATQPVPPVPTLPPVPTGTSAPTGSPGPTGSPPTSSPSPTEPPLPGGPLSLTARRTENTLPDLPALGMPYVCLLDLFDEAQSQVGTATAGSMVVGVTLEGPVVLASVVLHLPDGEVHYQRIMDRFGGFPRTAVGAILGGTGAYRDARGEVDISWPDDEKVDLVVRTSEG